MARIKDAVIDDRMGRKKLEDVRVFVRDLFIYGFRDRKGLNTLADNRKRAADESRQIIASILHDYYRFDRIHGERYLIAIDTREKRHNPLHNIWKAKTFTGSDIMMYFYILDYIKQRSDTNAYCSRNLIFDYIQNYIALDEDGNERSYSDKVVLPLFIIRNVKTGRQYLVCRKNEDGQYRSLRLDYIRIGRTRGLKLQYMGPVCDDYEKYRTECRKLFKHIWGVNLLSD